MALESNKNIFGLDISDQALRLVKLKGKKKRLILAGFNEVKIPAGVIINGEVKQVEKFSAAIDKLIASVNGQKITNKNATAVLPESKTFIKLITVPVKKKSALEKSIREEIPNHIPLNINELYIDWQIVKEGDKEAKVLVGAAPKIVVDSYFTALEKSGVRAMALEIEAAAIIRCLILENDNTARIIIDFGAARTGLIVYDQGTIQFTVSLPISGNGITDTISKTLNLDRQKAEKAKIVCGLDPSKCEGALLKILDDSINQLVDQIKKTIKFYQINFQIKNKIGEIVICGGGANFLNIDKILTEKLKVSVKIGDPLTNIGQSKKLNIPKDKALSYTTAIGLAMRFFHSDKLWLL